MGASDFSQAAAHRRGAQAQGGLPLPHRRRPVHRRHRPGQPEPTPSSCARRMRMPRSSPSTSIGGAKTCPAWSASSPARTCEGKIGGLPCGWLINNPDGTPMKEPPHPMLAQGKVRYVGDHVAMVVAETLEQATQRRRGGGGRLRGAARVVNVGRCRQGGGVRCTTIAPDNQCYKWALGDKAQVDAAFAKAAHVTKLDLVNNRLIPNAIEPRAAIGSYSRANDEYTLYVSNQNPHVERLLMTAFVLGLPEHKVRVIAPDVGGGFGSKIYLYAEDVCLTWAAKQLNRSIKWTAERTEILPVRRAWPRPRQPCRDGDGQGRQVPGAARAHRRQPGRLPVDLLHRSADHPVRHAAGRSVHHAADLCGGGRLVHQHRAGRCLPRRRAARGHLPAGAPGQSRCAWELGLEQDEIRKRNFITQLPLPDAGGAAVRHRRLRRLHEQGAGAGRRGRLRAAQGRQRGQGASCAAWATPATSRPAASRRPTSPARWARAPACSNAARSACTRPAA